MNKIITILICTFIIGFVSMSLILSNHKKEEESERVITGYICKRIEKFREQTVPLCVEWQPVYSEKKR